MSQAAIESGGIDETRKELKKLLAEGFMPRILKLHSFDRAPVILQGEINGDPYLYINTYHYLDAFLERDSTSSAMERELYRFSERYSYRDSWARIIYEYVNKVLGDKYKISQGVLGSAAYGDIQPYYLADDLAFYIIYGKRAGLWFECYEDDGCKKYIVLMVHRGGDIRVNWSDPKIFKLIDIEGEPANFTSWMGEVYGWCPEEDISWSSIEDKEFPFKWDRDKKSFTCPNGEPVEFSTPVIDYV